MKKGILLASFIALGAIMACSSVRLYEPKEENAHKKGIELAQLQTGKKLYVKNCGSCHNLHKPSEFSADQWTGIMTKMQKKAKISDESRQLIYGYLVSE